MYDPVLILDEVTYHLPDRQVVLEAARWRLSRGTHLRMKGDSPQRISAFLRLCAGLAHPESGIIKLDGEPLNPYRFSHPFRDRGALAWVPSGGGLLVNQSLLANVALPLRFVRGLSRSLAEEEAMAWLERSGLASMAERRPHALTPQERWMGTLARAAATGPELWLVDSPQGGLNQTLRRRAWELLSPILESPTTAVLLADGSPWSQEPPMGWLQLEEGTLSSGSQA